MKLAIVILAFVISGCSTTVATVNAPWPSAPKELLAEPCRLEELREDSRQLSELLSNAAGNYGCAHATRDQVTGWQLWYRSQQRAFEALKK